jgi:hypothetical protein
MNIIQPSIEVCFYLPKTGKSVAEAIEQAARTYYKSESRITEGSADKFVRMLRTRGHHAMLEFGYVTAKIILLSETVPGARRMDETGV